MSRVKIDGVDEIDGVDDSWGGASPACLFLALSKR